MKGQALGFHTHSNSDTESYEVSWHSESCPNRGGILNLPKVNAILCQMSMTLEVILISFLQWFLNFGVWSVGGSGCFENFPETKYITNDTSMLTGLFVSSWILS